MTYTPYDQLLNWSLFTAVFNSYDTALGGSGLIYLVFYFGILAGLALATESPAAVGVWNIVCAAALISFMPVAYHGFVYGIAVMGLAITFYKMFIHKRGATI